MLPLNSALLALLSQLAHELDGRAPQWADVVLVQNYGVIPLNRRGTIPPHGFRGFNLALLGADGQPRHFARCRRPSDEGILDETRLLECFAAEPATGRHVPAAVFGAEPEVAAQLARYLPGVRFTRLLRRMSPGRCARATSEILAIAERLGAVADRGREGQMLNLAAASEPLLVRLRQDGLEAERVNRLEALLAAAGAAPAQSQHGDLWAPNVIRHEQVWVLVDFEHFGRLQVPLVDAVQLVRSTSRARWRCSGWISSMLHHAPSAKYSRAAMGAARARLGLPGTTAAGCVAFALLEITARFSMAGRPPVDWLPSLEEVRALADLARDPQHAAVVLFGAEG